MPSIAALSETLTPSADLTTKPKKMKNVSSETVGPESSIKKKEKKSKKEKTTSQSTDPSSDSEKSEKKVKRKRKASSDTDNEEGKSDTSSELGEPVNIKVYRCFFMFLD